MNQLQKTISIGLLATEMLWAAAASGASLVRQARLSIDKNEFGKALALLDEGKKMNARDVEISYLRGYVLYRQHELEAAKQELKATINLAPPSLQSRYLLGRIAQFQGQNGEAIRWLEPCARANPPIEDAPARISKLYWDTGRVEDARVWTGKALAMAPWDGSLHYRLGRIYQQAGQSELARREFTESMKSKTADAEGVRKLMECSRALASHDMAAALRIRNEFLDGPQLDPDLLVALGTDFATAGAPEQAIGLFQTAAVRDPQSFQAQFNIGLAKLNMKEPEAAVEPLKTSLRLLPVSKEANAALALAYVMQGKFKESVEPLEVAREADPGDRKTAGLLSLAYYRSGAASKAVPILRQTIAKSKDDPKVYFLLIDCLNATEKQQDALAVSDEAVRLFPDLAKSWLGKAQQLARLGRYHEAGPLFAKAAELAPDEVEPLLGLGEAQQKDGEYQAALASYQRALSKDGDLTAALGAARNLIFLNRLAEARTLLEHSAAENRSNSQLHFELSRVYARLGERRLAEEQTRIVQQLRAQPGQENRSASAPQ
jgi:tetratricopeptide (TPR) repeat protein